ncbi:hypothetical protein C8F04DRAFT_1112364 [Mycena alexandri]|uniref:Uncharacterized protein n=1 Tax=Mycena alexandri TaxID=1745969 RepID=A0AAD6X051_9AGAR|nr:hypothetical protein C8F04DRAFT_1112364 [Mycena alexandri]
MQLMVRIKNELLSGQKWMNWISHIDYLPNTQLEARDSLVLCFMVHREICCGNPNENDSGFCENCKVQFVDEPSELPQQDEPVSPEDSYKKPPPTKLTSTAPAQLETSADALVVELPLYEESTVKSSLPEALLSESPETTVAEAIVSPSVALPKSALPLITDFLPSNQNSFLRRRRRATDSYHPPNAGIAQDVVDDAHHPPKSLALLKLNLWIKWNEAVQLGQITCNGAAQFGRIPWTGLVWLGRSGIRKLATTYIFSIAPPFLQTAEWTPTRLNNRLKAFQGWVVTTSLSFLAVISTVLGLSALSSSPTPQSLLILSAIFCLFAFIYSLFLAHLIAEHKEQLLMWFDDHRYPPAHRPFWNASIMMSLPLTWLAWIENPLRGSSRTRVFQGRSQSEAG